MAYTSHGHHIWGSTKTGTPPKHVTRCGGTRMACKVCVADTNAYWQKYQVKESLKAGKEAPVEVVMLGDMVGRKKAQTIVENYISSLISEEEVSLKVEAYVMVFTRMGDSWKATLTTNTNPNAIYEVTYLADHKVASVRIFSVSETVLVGDGD